MTLAHRDLGRSLLVVGALLLACTPTPSEVETFASAEPSTGPGDTSVGPGPGTLDSGTSVDTVGGTDDTGPSFDPVCGDGIVETPEQCDLGELNGTDMYCTEDCRTNVCGDGYVGPGEACDDGNQSNEDLCTTDCGPTSCGDGVVQGSEECDDGTDNAETGACLPSCVQATCGDALIHAREETCDGNNIGRETCASQGFDDGVLLCTANCMAYDTSNCYACGNGVIEAGESCDGIVYAGDATCESFAPGGSTVSSGELACANQCTNIDSSACTFCGDGIPEGPEQCDGAQFGGSNCGTFAPGGTTASGGALSCTAGCAIDSGACTYCGDSMREGTEVCDGNQLNNATCVTQGFVGGILACANNCMAYNTTGCSNCGNGVINGSEECDGLALGTGTCATEVGAGYTGGLTCNTNCTYNIGACCLPNNEPCNNGSQCCSTNCTNFMGNQVCRP